jgi:outer membrane receptor protein involved in Fe transport
MNAKVLRRLKPLAAAVASAVSFSFTSDAAAQLEEVMVVAQKRSESAQDVPIAISAFDENAMRDRQIVGFADMRFNAPNIGYNKGNFTGNNFQIRGVGTNLVAASADSGVGVHVNEVFIVSPRLFETEYYDVAQVEILRGPQGTLYGRNSTGGAVNMITRLPEFDEMSGNLEGQYGNFDHTRLNGAINLPISDTLAVRAAGIWLEREGYTENILTGNDVDGRDQWSARFSVRWLPTATTEVQFMASYFEEDSSRSRSQKTMCNNDPSGILGCIPDRLAFDVPNPSSQLANILVSDAVITGLTGDPALGAALGLFPLGSNERGTIPADIRKVASEQDPIYESDETLATLVIKQEAGDHLITFVGGYQDTSVLSQMDYQWTQGQAVAVPALFQALAPQTTAALYGDGLLPISAAHPSNTGVVGGHVRGRLDTLETYDQSNQSSEQWSAELRIQSDYEGRFNFLAGAFWMDVDLDNDYYVLSNAFDYFATLVPALNGLDGFGWAAPHFNNATPAYNIESQAVFGEAYFELTDDVQLTVGARYTIDNKTITDRQFLLNEDPVTGAPGFLPLGAQGPVPGETRQDAEREWKEWTGRVVLDWSVSENTMAYASYSRGYKGGGFNPPFDPQEFPDQRPDFAPEFVDAYELGVKKTLFDNTLQANLTAFWYDYSQMQVSKIVNRTSFNENTDATIWGFEGEFVYAPTPN